MNDVPNKYKPVPFWSWNDELDENELVNQIQWMHDNGIGGFFMHARGGLTTPYLGEKWFSCVRACLKKAKELNMEAYAYDENGWPSGFVGGKLLEDEKNRDMYVTYAYGKYDDKAAISYDVSGNSIVKVTSGENVLNIYLNVATSTADILNKDVVRKFINLTHEQYKKNDIYANLRGFFTDEPQYYRWATPFTRVLNDYFKKHYQEDVLDRIGLLFVEKEGYEDYRYKYFKAMQDLMLNSFAKQIYDWCSDNNYKLTGHYVEECALGTQLMCCGGIMPFYEYEHIPGVDHLGRPVVEDLSSKQLSSVMSQLDKRQGLCEMFACVGWDATPLELKRIAEYYMVAGINIICHHLLPYSEHGQRKRDYPEHYSKINPWVDKSFKDFNDFFSKTAMQMSESTESPEVGLFHPIRSATFNYKRELDYQGEFGVGELNKSFTSICNKLIHHAIPFHMLDEVIMAKHAYVEGDALVVGRCRYKCIVISEGTLTMDKTTYELFKKYSENGGKFHIVKDVPTYLEGKPFKHDYMKNNASFEDLLNTKPFISSYNEQIRIAYRVSDKGIPFIYAVNIGESESDIEISVPYCSSFKCNDKIIGTKMHFNKGESKLLFFSNEKVVEDPPLSIIKLDNHFDVIGSVDNYLTLDYLSYSTDNGKTYSKKMHYMAVFNLLLESRYQGEVHLKYKFDVKSIPSICDVLLEDTHTLEVKINGDVIKKDGTVLEKDLWKYNLSSHLKEGHNEIIIKINFIESEQVYYALYGENVTESIKNCLAYDTTIEAIYLRGNFGVFGDFKDGNDKEVIIGENFYLDKPKNKITSLIKDGYPFVRGNICLEQTIDIDNVNKMLVIDKRFHLIDLYVNDIFVKRMLFDYKVDLSKYLKVGKNIIKLDLVVSNRNLLGPHHHPIEEPMSVGPHTFERLYTWDEDGHSDFCVDRYSFVKTII